MSRETSIEWTDATWNIAVGCTKVDEDCKFCYMYRDSLNGTRYDPKTIRKTKSVFKLPLVLKKLPANAGMKIFTSSLTDVFHEAIDPFRNEMWEIIRQCPEFIFQILTKRPERIKDHLPTDWGEGYPNVWLGVSAGSQKGADERIPKLLEIPAKVRFVSVEPMWTNVELFPFLSTGQIHWVIVGGESGNEVGKYKYRHCNYEWLLNVVVDCHSTNVPVFVKQLGTSLAKQYRLKDRHGRDMSEWPDQLIAIRNFPNTRP